MTIENYTDQRREDVYRLVKEFHDESLHEYGQKLETEALFRAIEKYRKHIFLLVKDGKCVGILAGMEVRPPFSNDRIFHELIWYVSKPFRLRGIFLLRQVIKVLKADGYNSLIMTVMHNSKMKKIMDFYKAMGFTGFETHYIKKL